jgi:(hydroxyamino)benzene mutase
MNRSTATTDASTSSILSRQSRRLLQIGAGFRLYSFFDGFPIPYLASPRIGLSVHTLAALQSVLLLALGLVWPKLPLGPTSARLAFWSLVYSASAILAAYTLAALWGVGNETIQMMGELPHWAHSQEPHFRRESSRSSLIPPYPASCRLRWSFWGLRMTDAQAGDTGSQQ